MKFGGSSLADAEQFRRVGNLIRRELARTPVVVLSASGETTDRLLAAASASARGELEASQSLRARVVQHHRDVVEELFGRSEAATGLGDQLASSEEDLAVLLRGIYLLRESTPRSRDAIAAIGEDLSTAILAAWLVHSGVDCERVDARQLIATDERFGAARIDRRRSAARIDERLRPQLGPGRAVITQGFVGATALGLTTTLGRGGSDLTAAILGADLGSEEVQIWTDVEGVHTCDPRMVERARPIERLSFAEASELALFGARVLHPATIEPAVERGIPVTVRHTGRPEGAFTTIEDQGRPKEGVTALASRGPVTIITVGSPRMVDQSGFLAALFSVFSRHEVSVDLVATAESSVSLTVDGAQTVDRMVAELEELATVEVRTDRVIVAVVGQRLRSTPGLCGAAFGALVALNIEMVSMGANEVNLSFVVREQDRSTTLTALHDVLFPWSASV